MLIPQLSYAIRTILCLYGKRSAAMHGKDLTWGSWCPTQRSTELLWSAAYPREARWGRRDRLSPSTGGLPWDWRRYRSPRWSRWWCWRRPPESAPVWVSFSQLQPQIYRGALECLQISGSLGWSLWLSDFPWRCRLVCKILPNIVSQYNEGLWEQP